MREKIQDYSFINSPFLVHVGSKPYR